MKGIALGSLLLVLAGCDKLENAIAYLTPISTESSVVPCYVTKVVEEGGKSTLVATNVTGYRHVTTTGAKVQPVSHCLPCANAVSKAEHLACEGDKQ
jgi:hypothetical protein